MPSWPTFEDMAANAQFNFAGSLLSPQPNCLPYQALTCLCYNMHLPKARGPRYPTPRVALSSLGRQLFKIPSPQEALKTLQTSSHLPYRSYSPTCCYPVPGWSSLDVFSTVEPSVTEFCLPALWVSLCFVSPVKDNLNLTPQLHPDEKANRGHWGNPDIGKNRKGTPVSTLLEPWPWEGRSCMGAQISVDRLLLVQTPPEAEREEGCLGPSPPPPPGFCQRFPLAELPETSWQGVWETDFPAYQDSRWYSMFTAALFTKNGEATQVSRWMDKHTVRYIQIQIHNGILFSLKKSGNRVTCYSTGGPWKPYTEQNRPITKRQILSASTNSRNPRLSNS